MDTWITTRETTDDDWGVPVNLGPIVNSPDQDYGAEISADGLCLIFCLERPGGYGGSDIYATTRETIHDEWGISVNLGSTLNDSYNLGGVSISTDGRLFFFNSSRPGGLGYSDIWQVSIDPVVDLNADEIVDAADMCIMVDNWGTDNPLCDIGPMPWGDGIVDVQDLIILSEHLFDEYRALAQWKLDEKEGGIAYDSVGGHDGILYGGPIWQPTGGQIVGALELDRIDDYISAPFLLNPGKESIGAFAWIKGGSPGQVIISQIGDFGDTWVCIDPLGKLLTELGSMYFGVLTSETIVTDDQWHHVGLVYDMDKFHRLLYVDGVMEAEDTTFVAGTISDGGLYIGASKDLDATSFFSGLIDDVCIYDVVLSAEEIAALAQ